jgi:hypothetical protein
MLDTPDLSSEPRRLIECVTFDEPVELPAVRTSPNVGLYQRIFPLSEADYLRLKQSDPVYSGIGGAVLSFGLGDALAQAVRYAFPAGGVARAISLPEGVVALAITFIGFGFLMLSHFRAKPRLVLLHRIGRHFDENPGTMMEEPRL